MADEEIQVLLTQAPLDEALVRTSGERPQAGAVVVFVGTTRDRHEGRRVLRLEYEAQGRLALKTMRQLCVEARERFGLAAATLHHRLGTLQVGEASVVIAVSAGHRGPAFEGCRFLIDALKRSVPIFKKEHFADGGGPLWVGPDGRPVQGPEAGDS
jgi:molybdopterin synthase catalytic subunit